MSILSATDKRSDPMVISVVTMASKLFCSVFVVLNSIIKVAPVCPYPPISNHGIGRIVGTKNSLEVRTLQENEKFIFGCQDSWTLMYLEDVSFICRGGVLQTENVIERFPLL